MDARFEIDRDAANEYRWRLVAPNNEIVAVGEGYRTKEGAIRGAETVKRYATIARIVDRTIERSLWR